MPSMANTPAAMAPGQVWSWRCCRGRSPGSPSDYGLRGAGNGMVPVPRRRHNCVRCFINCRSGLGGLADEGCNNDVPAVDACGIPRRDRQQPMAASPVFHADGSAARDHISAETPGDFVFHPAFYFEIKAWLSKRERHRSGNPRHPLP